jgi:hypothetical protein
VRAKSATVPVALLGAAVVVAALSTGPRAVGTGAVPTDHPVRGNSSLREARAVHGFGVYFAGVSLDGLPLTAVEQRSDEARYVSFLYGDCRADDHQGCALPLEIQTWPSCRRSLALYDPADPFAPVPAPARVRGAPAGVLDDGRHLEIRASDSTIVIFGESRALVSRAAVALRGVNVEVRPGDPLGSPVTGAELGEPACP